MAIGDRSNFQIFEEQFHGGFIEVSQQNAQELIAPSRGAIRLVPRAHRGDFLEEGLFTDSGGLVSRRDTDSTSSVSDTALSQDEDVKVKLNRRMGPVAQTLDSFRKIEEADAMARLGQIAGQQAAQDAFEDQIDRALAAVVNALETEGSNDQDETSTGTMETKFLARALKLMGDKASRVVAWVMHSNAFFDLLEDQIVNGPTTDNVAGFAVVEGMPQTLNRPVLITDSSSLVETDGVSSGTDEHRTLGLTEDAIRIFESEGREVFADIELGRENVVARWQGEYAYTLGVKGFKWDISNGGRNPTDSAVATGTNWDKWVSDMKLGPGTLLRTQ